MASDQPQRDPSDEISAGTGVDHQPSLRKNATMATKRHLPEDTTARSSKRREVAAVQVNGKHTADNPHVALSGETANNLSRDTALHEEDDALESTIRQNVSVELRNKYMTAHCIKSFCHDYKVDVNHFFLPTTTVRMPGLKIELSAYEAFASWCLVQQQADHASPVEEDCSIDFPTEITGSRVAIATFVLNLLLLAKTNQAEGLSSDIARDGVTVFCLPDSNCAQSWMMTFLKSVDARFVEQKTGIKIRVILNHSQSQSHRALAEEVAPGLVFDSPALCFWSPENVSPFCNPQTDYEASMRQANQGLDNAQFEIRYQLLKFHPKGVRDNKVSGLSGLNEPTYPRGQEAATGTIIITLPQTVSSQSTLQYRDVLGYFRETERIACDKARWCNKGRGCHSQSHTHKRNNMSRPGAVIRSIVVGQGVNTVSKFYECLRKSQEMQRAAYGQVSHVAFFKKKGVVSVMDTNPL